MASLCKEESVLEHAGMVALTALRIGIETDGIDIKELLIRSLIHDIEECMTGDLPSPTKYVTKEVREGLAYFEKYCAGKILNDAGLSILMKSWENAKVSREGDIVAFSDAFTSLLKFHDEIIIRGNKSMIPLISPMLFQKCERALDRLLFTRNSKPPVIYEYLKVVTSMINDLKEVCDED